MKYSSESNVHIHPTSEVDAPKEKSREGETVDRENLHKSHVATEEHKPIKNTDLKNRFLCSSQ